MTASNILNRSFQLQMSSISCIKNDFFLENNAAITMFNLVFNEVTLSAEFLPHIFKMWPISSVVVSLDRRWREARSEKNILHFQETTKLNILKSFESFPNLKTFCIFACTIYIIFCFIHRQVSKLRAKLRDDCNVFLSAPQCDVKAENNSQPPELLEIWRLRCMLKAVGNKTSAVQLISAVCKGRTLGKSDASLKFHIALCSCSFILCLPVLMGPN